MGTITRSLSNNITTGGIILPAGITNSSVSAVTSFSGVTGGGTLVLLSTQTASSSATISFTTGLDSTYDEYVFKFINCHPATDSVGLQFNMSTDAGSNYNVTKTTTSFGAYHNEGDTENVLTYNNLTDLAQSTSFQSLNFYQTISNDADSQVSGTLTLFNPSSTTYVKHFISRVEAMHQDSTARYAVDSYIAGYGNTTSAINAVQFKFSSGNIDDGIIKLYGVKKS
jgi:hypothetical protein